MEEIQKYLQEHPQLTKLLVLAVSMIVIWVLVALGRKWIGRQVEDHQMRYRATKISGFVGFFVTLLVLSLVYSEYLGGITVALGVAGAGIAFALQEVITSVAGWISLSFGGFYKIGDRVQLGGIKGDVIDIGVLRTTVMEVGEWVDGDLYNGRIVRIANSFVFKEPVFNYSGDFPFLWDEIKLPIQFSSDYKLARKIIEQAAEEIVGDYASEAQKHWAGMVGKFMVENASTQPMVSLVANDNWVAFTLRYVVDFKKRRLTKDLLFSQIIEQVHASEGKVKFASATFQLVEAPEIKVSLNPSN